MVKINKNITNISSSDATDHYYSVSNSAEASVVYITASCQYRKNIELSVPRYVCRHQWPWFKSILKVP